LKRLTTTFPNAWTIDQFTSNLQFTNEDYESIFKSTYFPFATTKILLSRLNELPQDQRPLFVAPPSTDSIPGFYINTTAKGWVYEDSATIEHMYQYGMYSDEAQPQTIRFLKAYNDAFYDQFKTVIKHNKELKKHKEVISEKLFQSVYSAVCTEILRNLTESSKLCVDA
jgi:hypothetical protein